MYKVGDLVKINLEYIKSMSYRKLIPKWYTSESFEIISIDYTCGYSGHAYLNRNILGYIDGNRINIAFIMIDIIAMRKKKLEVLNNV